MILFDASNTNEQCAVGDSEEEQWAAENQQWPFTQISTAESCRQADTLAYRKQDPATKAHHPLSEVTASMLISRSQA